MNDHKYKLRNLSVTYKKFYNTKIKLNNQNTSHLVDNMSYSAKVATFMLLYYKHSANHSNINDIFISYLVHT